MARRARVTLALICGALRISTTSGQCVASATGPLFSIVNRTTGGACNVSATTGCVSSRSRYRNGDGCFVCIHRQTTLTSPTFSVEQRIGQTCYDRVVIPGLGTFCGNIGPFGVVAGGTIMEWFTDGNGRPGNGRWTICESCTATTSGPAFSIMASSPSGACAVAASDTCIGTSNQIATSGSSTSNYSNDERCAICVHRTTPLDVRAFDVEPGRNTSNLICNFDALSIGSTRYCDNTALPNGTHVTAGSVMTWSTDESEVRNGWFLCATVTGTPSVVSTSTTTTRPTPVPTTAAPASTPTRSPSVPPTTTAPVSAAPVTPTPTSTPPSSAVPTSTPTSRPTSFPTVSPTVAPSTTQPASQPTFIPTTVPSSTSPTSMPTSIPTAMPSSTSPTSMPTFTPTATPSPQPSITPTTAASNGNGAANASSTADSSNSLIYTVVAVAVVFIVFVAVVVRKKRQKRAPADSQVASIPDNAQGQPPGKGLTMNRAYTGADPPLYANVERTSGGDDNLYSFHETSAEPQGSAQASNAPVYEVGSPIKGTDATKRVGEHAYQMTYASTGGGSSTHQGSNSRPVVHDGLGPANVEYEAAPTNGSGPGLDKGGNVVSAPLVGTLNSLSSVSAWLDLPYKSTDTNQMLLSGRYDPGCFCIWQKATNTVEIHVLANLTSISAIQLSRQDTGEWVVVPPKGGGSTLKGTVRRRPFKTVDALLAYHQTAPLCDSVPVVLLGCIPPPSVSDGPLNRGQPLYGSALGVDDAGGKQPTVYVTPATATRPSVGSGPTTYVAPTAVRPEQPDSLYAVPSDESYDA
eukprot:m.375604 g.375604  ORF g.375604 m.375604 type:complete len:804 (-) comp28185_c0_seq3:97-2508(-)